MKLLTVLTGLLLSSSVWAADYVIVTDSATSRDAQWQKVIRTLTDKHHAECIVYDGEVESALPALQKVMPRYVCFVTRPEMAGTPFIVRTNRLIRAIDDDPYADAIHAVMTGYDAAAALRTAQATEPVMASTALLSAGVGPARFKEAAFISDGEKGRYGRKFADGHEEVKSDTSNKGYFFAEMLERLNPDVIMTSSHGSQVNIEMPFGQGSIVAKNGKIWMLRTQEALIDYKTGQAKKDVVEDGKLILIPPPLKPNVFFAFGNCLTGDVHQPDCIALDLMAHLRSTQFIGYCFTTWYGLQGGLTLRYWEQGGGYTPLNESHFFANQILLYRLGKIAPDAVRYAYHNPNSNMNMGAFSKEVQTMLPSGKPMSHDYLGMMWDRDCVAFFGDPKHAVYLDKENTVKPSVVTDFKQDGRRFVFTLHAKSDCGIPDPNTSPKAFFFPKKLRNLKLISGAAFEPLLTDDFIIVHKPGPLKKGESAEIVFEADPF